MSELGKLLLLAVVQGITEFLPISSSGHLVILGVLAGVREVGDVVIVLHLGTLGSILVIYGDRVGRLVGEDWRVIPRLVVGTVPAVLVGVPLKLWAADAVLKSPLVAGLLLIVTGLLLVWVRRLPRGHVEYQNLTYRQALVIGASQAAAILPGLSRSGTTIAVGMQQGLSPRAAATFSFLLAIPAILGAGVLEAFDVLAAGRLTTPPGYLLAAALVAFLVGLLALRWLIAWTERARLQWFAWWCIPLGIIVVAWQLLLLTLP